MHAKCISCVFTEKSTNFFVCSKCGAQHRCGLHCDRAHTVATEANSVVCTLTGIVIDTTNISESYHDNLSNSVHDQNGSRRSFASGYGPPRAIACKTKPQLDSYTQHVPRKLSTKDEYKNTRKLDKMFTALFFSKERKEFCIQRKQRLLWDYKRRIKRIARSRGWKNVNICDIAMAAVAAQHEATLVADLDADTEYCKQEMSAIKRTVMRAWHQYSRSEIWNQIDVDFDSFVLGWLMLCKTGRSHSGYSMIPRISFVTKYMPPATIFDKLRPQSGNRRQHDNCINKRRVFQGLNAIQATLMYEIENGPLDKIAVEHCT